MQHFRMPTREETGPGVASVHLSIPENRERMEIQGFRGERVQNDGP